MISLLLCVPWSVQHDRSGSVQLLWNAHASLSVYLCDLRLSRESRQAAGPRQEAGHDNEARVLQKLLLLLAGHRGDLKIPQENQEEGMWTLKLSSFIHLLHKNNEVSLTKKKESDVKCGDKEFPLKCSFFSFLPLYFYFCNYVSVVTFLKQVLQELYIKDTICNFQWHFLYLQHHEVTTQAQKHWFCP